MSTLTIHIGASKVIKTLAGQNLGQTFQAAEQIINSLPHGDSSVTRATISFAGKVWHRCR